MKKSMVLVLITLMIISVFMISCNSDISDNSSGGDKLVKVVFSTENTGSKGISATPTEAAGPNTLYWYYKASKADSSLYRTGETVALGSDGNNGAGGWKAVNPDGNGNAQAGFATSNDATYQSLKYFSEGSWVFSFRAYSVAVDWDTTNKDQAYITDNSQTTKLDPVYYQDNLSASITSATIASDGKYHISISPTAGDLGNAVLVFPTTTGDLLNWKYDDDNNGVSTATLAALSGKSAVMKVFYTTDTAITSSTQWTALAISTNDNAISDGVVAFGDFVSWNGTTTNGEDITLESSVAGIDYKLRFEVWSTDLADNDVMLGSFNLQSATAYLGGKIELAIASGSTYAVTDNESQIEAVITDVNPVAVVVQATTASATATSATATIVAPAAPEIASADAENKTTKTASPALKIESSVSAVSTGGANTGVSIPEGGLADTTTTATYENDGLTTTVTTSSTHNITIDVKNETNEAVTGAEFSITAANNQTVTHNNVVTLAGIDFTLTKTTTQTTTTYDSNGVVTSSLANTTQTNATVTDFNEKYTTVYATIKPNQTGVQVLYSGNNGAQPVFKSSNTNPSIAAAEADTTDSDVGTGYNPTTGLIVFKTNHFSQFYVTATPVASVTQNEVVTKYGTLEEAFAAADDNDTVTLLSDVTVSKATANAKGLFTLTKSITIDGNSKRINATNTTPGGGYFLEIIEDSDDEVSVTMKDLTINSTGYQVAVLLNCDYYSSLDLTNVDIECDGECIYSNCHSSVTASGCEFTHQGLYASGKDPVYYSAIIVGYGGDIELENCTITSFGNGIATFPSGGSVVASDCEVSINEDASSNENAGYVIWARNEDYTNYPEYCENSDITIVSGTYTGNIKVSQKNQHGASGPSLISKITIQGGTFIGNIESLEDKGSYSNRDLANHLFISGGTFSTDPIAYVIEGYGVEANSDNTNYYDVVAMEIPTAIVVKGEDTTKFYASNYTATEYENSDALAFDAAMKFAFDNIGGTSRVYIQKSIILSSEEEKEYVYYGGSKEITEITEYKGDDTFVALNDEDLPIVIIDLGGNTLEFPSNPWNGNLSFVNATVTIKDGNVTGNASLSCFNHYGAGNLTISKAQIIGKYFALICGGSSTVNTNKDGYVDVDLIISPWAIVSCPDDWNEDEALAKEKIVSTSYYNVDGEVSVEIIERIEGGATFGGDLLIFKFTEKTN